MHTDPSRRRFLTTGGATLTTGWLAANWPLISRAAQSAADARRAGAPLRHLDPAEAADLEAIAARILPATDTPGAREIGVIHFIDASIGSWMAGVEQMLRPALGVLNGRVTERYGTERFHQLDADAQDALLRDIENDAFFGTMRMMTLAGAFALPAYGGNRDHLGWALLGFDHRHVWAPPFGHYDAPYHQRAQAGAPAAGAGSHHRGGQRRG